MATGEWYWCLDHEAVEPADSSCPPGRRLGPYPSKEAAENWKEGVAKHNEEWDAEDEWKD
jgi:hypothetical protein